MSITHPAFTQRLPSTTTARPHESARKVLLAGGPLAALIYIGWHEIAALQWDGYSRISNAISELHLSGTPTKELLDPWEGIAFNAAMAAFGVGIWLSAGRKRSLRAAGAILVVSGATFPLWLIFGENLTAHIILSAVSVLTWLSLLALGAVAFPGRFRLYTIATTIVFLGAFGLVFAYAPAVEAGDPTPWMGLEERIAFSAFFLWQTVLTALLWRKQIHESQPAH